MAFEYQIGWSASSNASFRGKSGWMPWEGDEETVEAVEDALDPGGAISQGLEDAISYSGFEWWAEVRGA